MEFDRNWRVVPVKERKPRNPAVLVGSQHSVRLTIRRLNVSRYIVLVTDIKGDVVIEQQFSLLTGIVSSVKRALTGKLWMLYVKEQYSLVEEGVLECVDIKGGIRLFSTDYKRIVEVKEVVEEAADSTASLTTPKEKKNESS